MGGGTSWLAQRWLRQRWVAMLPLFVVVLVGVAGTVLAVDAAAQTSTAYRRYLERANVGDVVLNPSVKTTEVDAVIRDLPGVVEVTTDTFFTVTDDDGQPRALSELESDGAVALLWGSHDGRYTAMDRPVVEAGRLPTGEREVVVNQALADAEGLAIGDVVPLAFWPSVLDDGLTAAQVERMQNEVFAPIGVEQVEVVGIVTMADEVLPDDLYPRQRAILSPDIAAKYDCIPPAPASTLTLPEALAVLHPPDCASSYRYYSLALADGAAGVKPAVDEFLRRVAPLNRELLRIRDPAQSGADPPQYMPVSTESDIERRRVERAIRPTVAALGVLGLAIAVVTIGLAALAIARESRRTRPEQRQWGQLGVPSSGRTMVVLVPMLLAIGGAVALGVAAAFILDVGSLGTVRAIDPRPARAVSPFALAAAAGLAAAITVTAAALAGRSSRSASRDEPKRAARQAALCFGPPAVADGMRAATAQRGAVTVVAAGAIVSGALAAALVFAVSLTALVGTPRSYGWPWDVAAITGSGYGDLDLEGARRALDDDPAVDGWTAFGFLSDMSLDGATLTSIATLDESTIELPVVAGELPRGRREIALGVTTARERSLEVGDSVQIGGGFEPFEAEVSGLVVFPAVGPLFADRVGAGSGALLPQALVDDVAATMDLPFGAEELASFVGVDLADDASLSDEARVAEALAGLDLLGAPPYDYDEPVRPAEVSEARTSQTIPLVVAAVLAVLGALGLAVAAWSSARSRRRQLAVLRAMGFTSSQVQRSVQVQAVTTTVAALVIGVPLGVVAGRLLWRGFAGQLGVVPDPSAAWTSLGLLVVTGLTLAALAAIVPARRAAASSPGADLRGGVITGG